MKLLFTRITLSVLLLSIMLCIQPAFAKKEKKVEAESEQLLTRIDFGNSYISGQTLKSGAIYLLQRKKSDMKTMLEYRENYRKEILESHEIKSPEPKKKSTH